MEAAQVAELRREYTRFIDIANREYALLRAGDIDLAGAVQTEQGQPEAMRLQKLTGALVSAAEAAAAQEVGAVRHTYRTARKLLIAFIAVAALVGLYLAHTFSGSVVEPLREIGGRLAELARGGFAGRVNVVNRDEIGTLADNVNRASEQLGGLYADLEAEKERSEAMLYGILPRAIVERRRAGEELVADRVPQATVLFSDMAGFTELSDRLAPEEVVDVLDVLFSRFDAIAGRLGLEKIKTIGDGYMVAGGVLQPRADHAAAVAEMALAMRAAADIATRALGVLGQPIRVRIGVHSGPLVAGVLGNEKLVYDVWGDTVNTASRMEKYGEPGRIAVSAATRALLGNQFRLEPRGLIAVKGKGEMETFFLERRIGPQRYGNMVRRLAAARAGA
jgi:class 3 adenylate cyclase